MRPGALRPAFTTSLATIALATIAFIAGLPGLNPIAGAAPPPPHGACCFPDGSCTVLSPGLCAADSGLYQGDATTCSPDPCPQPPPPPSGACCVANSECSVLSAADCAAAGGTYMGDDVACDGGVCRPTATTPSSWGSVKHLYR